MPNTIAVPLPRHPEIAVEDLDVRRRTLALMRELCVRPDVRDAIDEMGQKDRRNCWLRTDGRRGVEIVAHEILLLLAAGATRAEVTLLPVLLMEMIDEVCEGGTVGGDRMTLELDHMRLDAAEDALQGPALVERESPEAMRERATALRKEAASALVLARELEGIVRRRTLGALRRTA